MDFLLLSITSLIALINPIGIIPTYIGLLGDHDPQEHKNITYRAILCAFIVLMTFSIMGNLIFNFFGITMDAFRIVGGILFMRIGLDMVESKISRTKSTPKEQKEAESKDEIAYSPLGVPLIAGPGAITSVMILSNQVNSIYEKILFILSIVICMILTYIALIMGNTLSKKIGTTGIRIIQRLMGIILMVIAIQFIIDGLTPIVYSWNFQLR
jgi:multiple antibiotic resistance protein